MTTDARQRLGSILGIAIMVATAAASSGGARAAGNGTGAAASHAQPSDKSADADKRKDEGTAAKTDGNAAAPPVAPKASTGPRSETRRGRGHF